jgi:hypothetical protein
MTAARNLSLATTKVGGREYNLKSVPTCFVCSSAYRLEVEKLLVGGVGYKTISRSLPRDANLSARNIGDHLKNAHFPLKGEAVARLREEQARERGAIVAKGAEIVTEKYRFARRILERVDERLAEGAIEPTVRDALAAAEFLSRFDDSEADEARDALITTIDAVFEIAEQLLDEDTYTKFSRMLAAHPEIRAMGARTGSG